MTPSLEIILGECNPSVDTDIDLEKDSDLKIMLSCSEEISVRYSIWALDEFEWSKLRYIEREGALSERIILQENTVSLEEGKEVLEIQTGDLTKCIDKKLILDNLIKPKINALAFGDQTDMRIYTLFGLEEDDLGLLAHNSTHIEIKFEIIESNSANTTMIRYKNKNRYNYNQLNQYIKDEEETIDAYLKHLNWFKRLDENEAWRLISNLTTLWSLGAIGKSTLETIQGIFVKKQYPCEEYQITSRREDVIKDEPQVYYLSNAVIATGTLINTSATHAYEIYHVLAAYEGIEGTIAGIGEYNRVEEFLHLEPGAKHPYSLRISTGNKKATRVIEDIIIDTEIRGEVKR